MQQKKTDPVVLGVLGCFVASFAVFVAAVVVVIVWARPRAAGSGPGPGSAAPAGTLTAPSTDPASVPPTRRPWEPIPAEPCVGVPGTTSELVEPLRVRDPARVDLAELYHQARPLVLRLEPNAASAIHTGGQGQRPDSPILNPWRWLVADRATPRDSLCCAGGNIPPSPGG